MEALFVWLTSLPDYIVCLLAVLSTSVLIIVFVGGYICIYKWLSTMTGDENCKDNDRSSRQQSAKEFIVKLLKKTLKWISKEPKDN